MSETITCFRFVTEDMRSKNGDMSWALGEWNRVEGPPELCHHGLHASENPLDSLNYIYGSRWFHAEARGIILCDGDKLCATEMRLTQEIPATVIQRFAVACAEHVLPLYEEKYPEDSRPRAAIEAARNYVEEPIEMDRAAAAAARDAAAAADAWAAEREWQIQTLQKLINKTQEDTA